jgi:hypothetical protein
MGTYNPLVDLMGYKNLGGKTFLFMIDALYAVQTERVPVSTSSKWLSAPFNNDWTSSLFLSQDNVAIESVGLDFFRNEQSINSNITKVYGNVDNYLHEASQADNPPSGIVYDPERDGVPLQSLGVHEHWNNAADKEYSRNLGTGEGIELNRLQGTGTSVSERERAPSGFTLDQNYPNPFNLSTSIRYRISVPSSIELSIYSMNGRKIRTLVNGDRSAGTYTVIWDGADDMGGIAASGMYFYRLKTKNGPQYFEESQKMLLIK